MLWILTPGMPFGSKCPACGSASVRLAPPASEQYQHFRCNECAVEFRELVSRSPVRPDRAEPRDGRRGKPPST
jgi:transposase-like protein